MGLITWIKAVWNKLFRKEIEERFQAEVQLSPVMEKAINEYYNITAGFPKWVDPEDDVESINFAGFIEIYPDQNEQTTCRSRQIMSLQLSMTRCLRLWETVD